MGGGGEDSREALKKGMREKGVSFNPEQRGRDEQGKMTEGLALGSLGSFTAREFQNTYYAPQQSFCKDAGHDKKPQNLRFITPNWKYQNADFYSETAI